MSTCVQREPRSGARAQNRVVRLFTDTLGYRDREQAMVQELLTGSMRLVESNVVELAEPEASSAALTPQDEKRP
jgi:hypothetical protein